MTLVDTRVVTGWQTACRLDDLEREWGEAALIDGHQVAVFRLWDDTVYAISNRDPVMGSQVLARGIVGSRGDRPTIASPLLKQVYDLGTGECLSHPDLRVTAYPTRVVGDSVEIQLRAA